MSHATRGLLKEGIGLRALAQRDPVVEYQREGYDMFVAMLGGVKEDFLTALCTAAVSPAPTVSATPGVAADTEPPTEGRQAGPGAVVAAGRVHPPG